MDKNKAVMILITGTITIIIIGLDTVFSLKIKEQKALKSELLYTKDLAGAGCCRRPPPLPRLDPLLKSFLNHFKKPDFFSVYEETESPAYHQNKKINKIK